MSNNPIFSYTKRNYESSRQEGLAKIPVLSKGNWTDLNATDPGVIILDYVHALVDMVNYYQDHQAMETFITTAKERSNIFRIAKQLSYDIRSAKGATCEVIFSIREPYDYTIEIPKHTILSTPSGVTYLTSETAYLTKGEKTVIVSCSQGTLHTVEYKGTGISRFSDLVGAQNQSLKLVDNNIDVDSITIIDSLGRLWNPIDYIVFSTELDRVYQVDLSPDDSVTIKFGDGERGIVPKESDKLTVTYITTLAEEGRVGKNELYLLTTPIKDKNGHNIDFLVNNNQASVGGSTSQSSREIRDLAPGAIKAQHRAVTLSDFENLAKLVDGVAEAKAYDINTKPDLCLYHEVKVLITPKDLDSSTDTLVREVTEYLKARMIPPTNLQVLTPSYRYIDLNIVVKNLGTTTADRLRYSIEQAVINYFSLRSGAVEEPFYPADLLSILRDIEGVRTIVSVTPSEVVTTDSLSVLRLGSIDVDIV